MSIIKTVGQLRKQLEDAPDDMPLRILYSGALHGVSQVIWLKGRCVLVPKH